MAVNGLKEIQIIVDDDTIGKQAADLPRKHAATRSSCALGLLRSLKQDGIRDAEVLAFEHDDDDDKDYEPASSIDRGRAGSFGYERSKCIDHILPFICGWADIDPLWDSHDRWFLAFSFS